ncbi:MULTISPECIES: divergent polysaccharide deacetylase family protein [Actibacterium]|uniref:Divergent polysaccharide deacetylase n=1 Tax=Actibacterium naphthalenivorans TaxID=1614693 RepID=A0A840CDW8_9RHOB|nr:MULTISPECIES: divergent polysaccharide deacetylase family protein [Actibacterium]MBB4023535.1 hypothetical protein [Actibacterium naphthalenivorans]
MKGVLGGLIWGVVAVVLALIVFSAVMPPPQKGPVRELAVPAPQVETPVAPQPSLGDAALPDAAPAAPEPLAEPLAEAAPAPGGIDLPPGSEFNRPAPEGAAILPGTDDPSLPEAAPSVAFPANGDMTAPPVPDTEPAGAPETGGETPETLNAPEIAEVNPALPVTGEQPVLPSPGAASPVTPSSEMQPVAPVTPPTPEPAPEDVAVAQEPAPATDPAPQPAPEPEAAAEPEPAPEPAAPQPEAEAETPAAEAAPEASPLVPGTEPPGALRVPVPGRQITMPEVRTGRLPSVGDDAAAPSEAARLGALARYAAPFEAADGNPLFSVILIDAGERGLDRATLTTFTFPVTFAVDAARADAAEAMRAYRAAGFEVVLIASGLPEGATPQDLEVTLSSYLARVPETVAVMDAETGGFQSNRPLLRQLMAILKESGHGLVTYDRGLNTAGQIATAAGIPSTLIFRSLDSERESVPTIRRYLDRAAFKAGQDGQVVMIGHTYPNTVTALFSWALEDKDNSVTLAPVSAILRGR